MAVLVRDSGLLRDDLDMTPQVQPFVGRIGGNQGIVLDRRDPANADYLQKVPDAAPLMSFRDTFNLRGFADLDLWRFAAVECLGTMMLSFITAWASASPTSTTTTPTTTPPPSPGGIYSTPQFLGPLTSALLNWLFLTLFIFTFSSVSGSHLNPTITFSTFFARLISFPRATLYLAGQTLGGALAGWMLRSAFGSDAFSVGGCTINTALVPVREAFLLEFICCLILIFLSFGVGLDPRQTRVYGAAVAPWLVGLVLGVVGLASAFTRVGFGGASLNPARCFGVYVGSSFPGYHWIQWVAPFVAAIGHGIVYWLVPPWKA
ncbi:aquaporin-like protein [Aspergillus heteromorphus CBS 117.55]|uniref:Aquaporin-like protein n=1 Tax=Aspergillus heteromorphus CBS 117.55 TaxID=1448321 RepID=A0A317WJV1_9EURO|nr:aquaporin-like protein [Aspergillus heteromorphus CBS 117.55]PWY86726.1 aquaporin-like protein [Aspergillus heteromorphus CBS 117.55]